jgi:hypothetical protein
MKPRPLPKPSLSAKNSIEIENLILEFVDYFAEEGSAEVSGHQVKEVLRPKRGKKRQKDEE